MITLIVVAVVVLAALWAVSIYNGLVRQKNVVAEGWSGLRNTANSVPLHGRAKTAAPSVR